MEQPSKIPNRVRSLEKRLQNLHRTWWFVHYSIGIFGIICAATLTAISSPSVTPSEVQALVNISDIRPNAWILGIAATICGSLVTLLGPLQKAEKYCAAHHIVDQAILEFEGGNIDDAEFFKCIRRARKVLQLFEEAGATAEISANNSSKRDAVNGAPS